MATKPSAPLTQLALLKTVPPMEVSNDTKAPPAHYRRLVAWTERPEAQRNSTADLFLTPYELRCMASDIRATINQLDSEHHDYVMADGDCARYLRRIKDLEAENKTLTDKLAVASKTDRWLTNAIAVIAAVIMLALVLAVVL